MMRLRNWGSERRSAGRASPLSRRLNESTAARSRAGSDSWGTWTVTRVAARISTASETVLGISGQYPFGARG